ncbi:MAG: hypothetical protein Kow00109_02540 [Acidobacteriota bacterium]
MWKATWFVTWIWVLSVPCRAVDLETLGKLPKGAVLVYEVETQKGTKPFVIRIARFRPDAVLEWESESHQGTVHFYRKALQEADTLLTAGVFEAGVDQEIADAASRWLPEKIYRDLGEKHEVRVRLNNFPTKLRVETKESVRLSWNGVEVEAPVLVLRDGRGGSWKFLDVAANPLLVEYSNAYYRERLVRIATENVSTLRWIKNLPPIK